MSYFETECKYTKMIRFFNPVFLLLTILFIGSAQLVNAQITSPSSDYFLKVGSDSAYFFCTKKDKPLGSLTARTPMGVSATFSWEKFDTLSSSFLAFSPFIEDEDSVSQTISRLEDGYYRVNISSGGTSTSYQAHVLNNWIDVTKAEIPDSTSTCEGFQVLADFDAAPLRYYNPQTNQIVNFRNNNSFRFKWEGGDLTSTSLEPYFDPVAREESDPLKLHLTITDQLECETSETVEYYSKIPKSEFSASPTKGEAVLKVEFDNKSINADSSIWYFYKSKEQIDKEIAQNKGLVDSIDFILFDYMPIHEFERSGEYLVKLLTVKVNPTTGNCYDTLHIPSAIVVDTSLIKVPNVFTPNGDGVNDVFVVQSQSLQSMNIRIYNRWGGLVHSWDYSNIRGRDYTYKHSVWDGRVNGRRMASPGVYFYVVKAVGRDGKKIKVDGFVHLFRNKD
jgi:gliding motility-associated-like protein